MDSGRTYKTLFTRKLAISSALILLIFCIVVAIQATMTHEAAVKQGKQIAERLTQIQTDHIELTISEVNLTLKAEAKHYYYNSLSQRPLVESEEESFRNWVSATPPVAWVMMTDADGNMQMIVSKKSYEKYAKGITTIKDEGFFKFHQKNHALTAQNDSIVISTMNRIKDKKIIVISQPLYKYDGSFAGVLAASIDADYFFNFFRTIEIGKSITMGIMLDKRQLVLSGGERTMDEKDFAHILQAPEFMPEKLTEITVRTKESGGNEYLVAAKKINTMNGVITLAFDRDEILENWRADRMTDLIFLILFTMFGAVLFSLILAMSKQIQKAEESEKNALLANQAKSEFLAKMSHELRTPLNAIIGFSEMIESGYFGPLNNAKQQERMHDINLCGTHLLQLINDILDYTKGEAGKLEIHESEFQLARVAEEATKMLREKAKRKNITISNNVPQDLPRILADERKIKQIMINLLSNAAKFTPNGGEVNIDAFVNKKGDIEISVRDTGIGIPSEEIPNALSVFGQVRNRSMEEEGTGLGLPLCKMLTELHGGVFYLESEVGVGTTAGFTIPTARVISRKTSAKKASAQEA